MDAKPENACADGVQVDVQVSEVASKQPSKRLQQLHDKRKKRLRITIFRFVATWLAFLFVLACISLLTNLEWARPKVEQAMSDAFHRPVKLGRIGWTLGLNGLSIWSDKLVMTEQSGEPFVVAGESEIGVAFLPLMHKRVIIKHVEFHHPEVYATQLAPGKWNFSDLLVEGPEIHYVEVDDGVLHLRNRITQAQLAAAPIVGTFANTKWQSYDFQEVGVKLIFPKKNQRRPWPFYLSFKLPRTDNGRTYKTAVSLTALCNGPFEKWQEHPCEIELSASQINLKDWNPFFRIPDSVDALFDFRYKGKGLITDALSGELCGDAREITVKSDQQPIFSAPEAKWESLITVSGKQIEWSRAHLDVAGVDIQSHGQVNRWREGNPAYQAVLTANLQNLSQLHDTSFWKLLPGAAQKKSAAQMSGAAKVELKLDGDNNTRNISTSLKANGVPLGNLLAGDGDKGAPFLSLFKVTPNAPLEGQILIDRDKNISLNNVEIPANGSKLKISGKMNAGKSEHDVEISSTDLLLDKFDTAQLEERKAPSILLSGKIDLGAHLVTDKGGQHMDVNAKLKNAVISAGKAKLADKLVGNIAFDGTTLKLDHVTGSIDNKDGTRGDIMLAGYIETAGRKPQCSLLMTGKRVEITQLVAFCQSAHLPISEDVVSNMNGLARDIEIKIEGDTGAPRLTLKLTPDDVAYQLTSPKGSTLKPVKITGGTIVLTSDGLELKDLPVTAQSGKLTLSASFVGSGNALTPRMVHVKTSGVSIEEVQQYLNSPDMPEQTRTAFANLVAPLQLRSAQGKTYGDLKVSLPPHNGACELDGTVSFTNVSGKVFDQQMPFDRLCGTSIVSANQLQLEDITFSSGSSHFFVDGTVDNIQQVPVWNLKLSSQFKPDDILAALPADLGQSLSSSSVGTLTLQASIAGDARSNKISFSARSHPGTGLKVQGSGWCFNQPADKTVTADGALTLRTEGKNNLLQAEGCHLFLGDSEFQGSGKYAWSDDSNKPADMELVLTAHKAVPCGLIVGAFFPNTDTAGAAGSIKGSLAFVGTKDDLLTHGDFALDGVCVPAWNLKDVNGRLHSPRWSLGSGDSSGSSVSQLQIQIATATICGVPARDLNGTVVLKNGREPRLSLNDGTASVAGGKVKVAAWCLGDSKKWHLDMDMDDLQVDEFVKGLIDRSGEVTGLADGHITLDSKGATLDEAVGNLQGSGQIHVSKGSVPKVAQLQEKLTQANLLQQGLFGFNLNNVLQTVLPGKAGKFKEANLSFQITDGVLAIDQLNFIGNDLRLRAAGSWNIPVNALNVDVAGNIPRVASSILPGAVGEVSRKLTIQKAVSVMTFNKLESLPTVPILGDIGTDDPRAFTFKISCTLTNPNAVQQSISKTFKWLPNKPNASAHPIPGFSNVTTSDTFKSSPFRPVGYFAGEFFRF
ncbi:MAG TPA: AsmA-like C-terminal region-containing protein [Candidatus Obscuribacterales bacterium]